MVKKSTGVHVSWPAPIFSLVVKSNKKYRDHFNSAMMYAHYEMNSAELKKEIIKYLSSIDSKHPLLNDVKSINEDRVVYIGKYMYILNRKGEVPDDIFPKLLGFLEKIIAEEKAVVKEVVEIPQENTNVASTVSIQGRMREKCHEVASEIEAWIDEFCQDRTNVKQVDDFSSLFKAVDLKGPHTKYMQSLFQRRSEEIKLVIDGKDKDLNEGYSNFTKPELKRFDVFFQNFFKACEMLQDASKVARAPKKKKSVSTEKLISKLKYKKDDPTLGLVSQNPIDIIGSKEVWLYNIKTKRIAHYKAADAAGLSVKTVSLINFSTDSIEKTLRKPAESLTEFKKASKIKLRTFMKDIPTVDTICTGKMNENHIILRIDK